MVKRARIPTALFWAFASVGLAQELGSPQVQEHISVERIVVAGRVIDRHARPIPSLGVADFQLRVDGQEAPLESVEWNPSVREAGESRTIASHGGSIVVSAPPPGQLFVMLFQWELAGQKDAGFLRMVRQALEFSEKTDPADRIAVFAFGSSLRLLQDFTTDRSAVRSAILALRGRRQPGIAPVAPAPSVTGAIDRCGPSDSIERAFICIGNALQPISGAKSVLFFGWTAASYRMSWRTRYPKVLEALEQSHATVFALDISDGTHRLAASLKQLAVDTGGLYQETYDFPVLARERLQATLEGSYEIVFRDPSPSRGWHRLDIELVAGNGTTLFPRWFRD